MERGRKDLTGEKEGRSRKGIRFCGQWGATLSEDGGRVTARLLNSDHHWLALPLAI